MTTLRQLEYLVAVAHEKHFGRAAERCHVSQPTLSAQLKELEGRLGVTLVERQRKNVLLTPVGEEVLTHARSALAEVAALEDLVKHSGKPLTGSLVLGAIPTIAPYYLPHVLSVLRKHYPKLKLYLKELQTKDLVREILEGGVDVGILALPAMEDKLEEAPLFDEPFMVALPKKNKLAQAAHIRVDDIKKGPLMLLEEGHCLRDQALEICDMSPGGPQGVNFRATSLETLKHMVSDGLGMTLLPRMAARDDEGYVVKPLTFPQPVRHVGLVWRRSSPRKAEFKLLHNALKA